MKKRVASFVIIMMMLLATIVISAISGSIKMGFMEFVNALFTGNNETMAVIADLRFPRIIVAVFAGAALSVAGVLLQAVMRNPLADAGVIGISSGSAFVSMLILTVFPGLFYWTPFFSFIGGITACFLVYALSWKSGLSPLKLILVGIAINAMFTGLREAFISICSYMQISIDGNLTSTLTMKTWNDVDLVVQYGIITLLIACFLSYWCNLLALQDKTTKSLGLRVDLVRIVISAVAVLLAAIATTIVGVISFVGLLIPHISRRLVGSDHKWLIPFSALAGAWLILAADTIGRTVISPMEIPASTIMSIIGGPFLIFLLRKD